MFRSLNEAEELLIAIEDDDKEVIVNYLPNNSKNEIKKISEEYDKLVKYRSAIIQDIEHFYEKHVRVGFWDLVIALFQKEIDYDAIQLHDAIEGLGTNEDTLIEILTTRSSQVISQIKIRYSELYPGQSLVNDIADDTSGYFREILLFLLENSRSTKSEAETDECIKLANYLYEAGEKKKIGTDEKVFTEILTKRSEAEIKLIDEKYKSITGHSIVKAIDHEFSFNSRKCLKAICYGILDRNYFFAKKIHNAIKGIVIDKNMLNRVIVTQRGCLTSIRKTYREKYGNGMINEIKDKIKENEYSSLLIGVIKND